MERSCRRGEGGGGGGRCCIFLVLEMALLHNILLWLGTALEYDPGKEIPEVSLYHFLLLLPSLLRSENESRDSTGPWVHMSGSIARILKLTMT